MAIFSVFHLWAFPWQVYDVKRSHIVAAESAPGFHPDPRNAYQGGFFGARALRDAFNPWDLIKAVGRAFKWATVGHRRRHEDISYKNSTGLEPTRNQNTAFENPGNQSFDIPQNGTAPYARGPGRAARYAPLDEEDSDRLLAHAQGNPSTVYPKPMERLPNRSTPGAKTGDIGTVGVYDHPNLQPPTTHLSGDNKHNRKPSGGSIETQDTAYHSSLASGQRSRDSSRLTPGPPPDTFPLGPPGRKSYEDERNEWDVWGGVKGSERDLGGGHGVADNQF